MNRYKSLIPIFAYLSILSAACQGLVAQDSHNDSWQPLFNGKDLAGWRHYLAKPDKSVEVEGWKKNEKGEYARPLGLDNDPLDIFTVVEKDGGPAIRISGQVIGNLFTEKQYENYHLKLQFRWGDIKWGWMKGRPRDGGILYHYNRTKQGLSWRHEYQIHEGDVGSWWAKHIRVAIPAEWTTDIPASIKQATPFLIEHVQTLGDKMLLHQTGASLYQFEGKPEWQICIANPYNEKPAGQWNTLEVICYENHALHRINGTECLALLNSTVMVDGKEQPVSRGSIQLQSEGAELFFRDVMIKSLDEMPKELKRLVETK